MFGDVRDWVRANKIHLYLVGGAIRDSFLGYPVTDLDFTYDGDAIDLARKLVSYIGGQVVVHPRFGTATISLGDVRLDLASCRTETYPSPGKLPLVSQGAIREELLRRDFTVNALAIPLWEDHPEMLDLSNGIADLRDRKIKVLHKNSFIDDPTRLFRAVKYEQRFDFQIDVDTMQLMTQSITAGSISELSGDRIRHELDRIFEESVPAHALGRLSHVGILDAVLPGLIYQPMNNVDVSLPSFNDAEQTSQLEYLVSLSLSLSPEKKEVFIQRLNMPKDWIKVISDVTAIQAAEYELTTSDIKSSRIYSLLEGVSAIAIIGVMKFSDSTDLIRVLSDYLTRLKTVTISVSGSDVIARGLHPGPNVGLILRELLLYKLDGAIVTPEDELEMLNTILVQQTTGQ